MAPGAHDFDATGRNRELRITTGELHEPMWDLKMGTRRAVDQWNDFIVLLDPLFAARIRH